MADWKFVLKTCANIILLCTAILLTFLFGFLFHSATSVYSVNSNALLIGHVKPVSSCLNIDINPPVCLNGFTRKRVYELRTKMIQQHPELILGGYSPAESVFGQIIDGKPWWGIVGEFFCGPGKNSIYGESEESRFILNPFLLASPELMGFTFYDGGHLRWKKDTSFRILEREKFPFYCSPQNLKWYPQAASAQVTYDVSAYLSQLNKHTAEPLEIGKDSTFELIAYNARDLGFNYLFAPANKAINISNDYGDMKSAIAMRQLIHCGGSCKYPGGCNNMSPAVPETDNFRINKLPAKLTVFFWRHCPDSIDNPPDMTYSINFN